jgi:hypothetical protein
VKKTVLAITTAAVIGFTVAHCSGCVLFIPEGQMTMEVSDE